MSDFIFSSHSLRQLATVDWSLRKVCWVALSIGHIDFRVQEGARTDERQDQLLEEGLTTLGAGQSKHNVGPVAGRTLAHAVDLVPVGPVDWDDAERFAALAGIMFASATIALPPGWDLRWGGDWDRDTRTVDETFRDHGHFEIIKTG